jgi:hypothetical protein
MVKAVTRKSAEGRAMADIRRAEVATETLALIAKGHRRSASQEQAMCWPPKNAQHFRDTQNALAEIYEELIDRRAQAGE